MTHPPDIINQNINKYAPAMDALAGGGEVRMFTQEVIADAKLTCVKLCDIWDKGNSGDYVTDSDDELEESYMQAIVNVLPDALTEIERLRAQLAERDALIERLVSVAEIKFHTSMPMNEQAIEYGGKWQKLVAEWKASKDGGEM